MIGSDYRHMPKTLFHQAAVREEIPMPRPCKRRRICSLPGCRRFGDLDRKTASVQIVMTLDEFEAVRLIDLEGLSQQ